MAQQKFEGYSLESGDVFRQGKKIAEITDTGYEMSKGQARFKVMVGKFLKANGVEPEEKPQAAVPIRHYEAQMYKERHGKWPEGYTPPEDKKEEPVKKKARPPAPPPDAEPIKRPGIKPVTEAPIEEPPEPPGMEGDKEVAKYPKAKAQDLADEINQADAVEPVRTGKFALPAGTQLQVPPKERTFPGHKATMIFQKNGRSYQLGLDYEPTEEDMLAEIEKFREP